MLIPSVGEQVMEQLSSLSRRVNANSQQMLNIALSRFKLIKKGEC